MRHETQSFRPPSVQWLVLYGPLVIQCFGSLILCASLRVPYIRCCFAYSFLINSLWVGSPLGGGRSLTGYRGRALMVTAAITWGALDAAAKAGGRGGAKRR